MKRERRENEEKSFYYFLICMLVFAQKDGLNLDPLTTKICMANDRHLDITWK